MDSDPALSAGLFCGQSRSFASVPVPDATRLQYETGVPDTSLIAPESYTLHTALLARPGIADIQLDLLLDYQSNVALYPRFQEYLRAYQPLLAVWGKNDPFFLPIGAEAFKRDQPNSEVHFFDTGHFALETHASEIATIMTGFLERHLEKANAIVSSR